jgi:phycocyanobilin lyase subunit alpha
MDSSLENIDSPTNSESLTIENAIANLNGTDLGLRFYAAWWLGRFRVSEPLAISGLIKALADEDDRTPEGGYPLRRNAARALGKLADITAVPPLITCLESSDYYVREAAAESLGMLGDSTAILPLSQLLEHGLENGELVATQPDTREPYDAILEALGTLKAVETIPLVQPFLQHPIERNQYSAARAMYQLTGEVEYGDRLIKALAGNDLQLRRSALADLGAIGYIAAADAIAQTLAENSLKLISLKGLLEKQVSPLIPTLSSDAIKVMNLMDLLL